ncbi:metallopeptidase family protein [Sinomonas atrocyanea]
MPGPAPRGRRRLAMARTGRLESMYAGSFVLRGPVGPGRAHPQHPASAAGGRALGGTTARLPPASEEPPWARPARRDPAVRAPCEPNPCGALRGLGLRRRGPPPGAQLLEAGRRRVCRRGDPARARAAAPGRGPPPQGQYTPGAPGRAPRITVYRRVVETGASSPAELQDLVHDIVVEYTALMLGVAPETLDPYYRGY